MLVACDRERKREGANGLIYTFASPTVTRGHVPETGL